MSFSFKAWPYPSPKKNSHILKCSQYGFIAHAMNNNVSIYFEEFGNFTPLFMFSPFQHQVTAMEWYDASKTNSTAVPVLVLSSISGRLEVFDCRSRNTIFRTHVNLTQKTNSAFSNMIYPTTTSLTHLAANSRRENDYVTSIAWSQFSSSSFYVGTKNGRLIRFEITIGQIVKCKVEWELFFNFQIDHICIESQFGDICAVASEEGSIATIDNINQYEDGKPPIASPNVVSLMSKTDSIEQINFYPSSTAFLILVTTSSSLLYSIEECCTAPLLMIQGIRKCHILPTVENLTLIVRDDSVEIWKFIENQFKRISELSLVVSPKYSNQKEILVSDLMGDKLVLLSSEMWLTTVELKMQLSKKLFITHRVKLLDSKPLSFSYANESISFATSKGNVLISETMNSNFIAQMAIESNKPLQNNSSTTSDEIQSSPLLENSESSQNNSSEKVGNKRELRRKLSESRSQIINLFDKTKTVSQKSDGSRKSRVRTSIIKSCASSTSMFLDSMSESNPQEEEILDKSIVYHKQNVSNNSPLVDDRRPNEVNIPQVLNGMNRKRRFSLNPSDFSEKSSFLSRLKNERIEAMPKDSSSAIPPANSPRKKNVKSEAKVSPVLTKSEQAIPTFLLNDKALNDDDKNSLESSRFIPKSKFGNNCTLMWNYQIAKGMRIENVEWIASTRLFAYTLAKSANKNEEERERSSRKNSIDSSDGFFDLTQLYSGTSFLYLIDLKYHRITRLFEKAGFNITAVAFSSNKQYFFVVINGFMAILFKNRIQPKQIKSFTFQKPIFVTFAPHHLVIIDVKGEMTFVSTTEKDGQMKETKKQLKLSKEYGTITTVCCKKNLIYMGTANGHILCLNISNMKASEVHQMKGSIVSFKLGHSGTFLAEDNKNKMIVVHSDGETTKIPSNIKFAIFTSPTVILIRRKKRNAIEIVQIGGQFSPSYPKAAYRCPLMMPTNRWIQSLMKEETIDKNILINYGLPNIANLLDARKMPNNTREQISFLRDIIMNTPQLWKMSYRLSIFLHDFDKAHSIIASCSDPSIVNDKWAVNVIKSVLFDKNNNEMNNNGILFAATTLIQYGFIDDGIDVLLSSGLWIDAVNLLLKLSKLKYAALITRVYRDEKSLDVVKNVTSQLFQFQNMIPIGLTMLCEVGLENEVIEELDNIEQFYSAHILRMVKDNESLNK